MPAKFQILLRAVLLVGVACSLNGQILFGSKRATPKPAAPKPMRKASELISKQEPVKINTSLIKQITPDTVRIVVSLPKKRGHSSPSGHFPVLEKDPDHRSNIYGDFVDSSGRVVRAGISSKIDSAPSGTHYVGAPMRWFMRLTAEGVGMHVGILPGYPASHGCIRMPPDGAKLFYDNVKVGTPADVGDY